MYAYSCRNSGTTDVFLLYHINHDWAIGTSMYLHLHHSTNATNETGRTVWNVYSNYAKRGSAFAGTEVTGPVITYQYQGATDQYRHIVTEVLFAQSGGGTYQIDTANLDVDTIVIVRLSRTVGGTSQGFTDNIGSSTSHFIFTADIHYQADKLGTINKAAPFNG